MDGEARSLWFGPAERVQVETKFRSPHHATPQILLLEHQSALGVRRKSASIEFTLAL